MTMKALGIHLLIEFASCNRDKADNLAFLEAVMRQAAEVAGATVLKTAFQDFNPQGVSGVVVIMESHLTIHTWPEFGYAAVDIFTCGNKVDPWKAASFLQEALEAGEMQIRDFRRGLPSDGDSPVCTMGNHEHDSCWSAHHQ
jgi:S-adenosylmethionine decarboxylase proenzyme